MNKERKSFIFHKDWYDAISILDDVTRCQVYDAIMEKVWGDESKTLSDLVQMAMCFISPQIDHDTAKWLETKAKRKESGKLGGLAKQANATKCYQMIANDSKSKQNVANLPVSVSVSDNVSVDNNNVILKEKEDKSSSKKKRFVKPTIEEIDTYVKEKGYHIDAENFFNFYESKGWVVGKSPMKDWEAACRNWENKWKENNPQQQDIFTAANKDVIYNTWSDTYTPHDGQQNQKGEVWSSRLNTWLK